MLPGNGQRFAGKRLPGSEWRLHGLTLAQDLVCLPRLTHFPSQLSDPIAFNTGRTLPCPAVLFRLPDPDLQCLWDAANFLCSRM